jgi:nicotinamide-nucleotide amidase
LAGVPLVQDEASLAHIKALFASRKREMPPSNVIQAQFPKGSRPIHNPHGSAPGIDMVMSRSSQKPARIFALPGVPAEMKEMWAASVGPAIQELLGIRKVIAHYRIKCFGVGESDLEAMLPDLIARDRYPTVGITVHQATITLRITAEGETAEAARAAMQPTIDTIHQCLGDLVFGNEDDELQDVVLRQLRSRGETLAVAEWGTGGLICDWLRECKDAREVFDGGLVLGNHVALQNVLPVKPEAWLGQGFRNADFTRELARATLEQFGSDWVLAIGPFPSDSEADRAVFFGLACKDGVATKPVTYAGHPSILKPRAGKQALDWLRKRIQLPTTE